LTALGFLIPGPENPNAVFGREILPGDQAEEGIVPPIPISPAPPKLALLAIPSSERYVWLVRLGILDELAAAAAAAASALAVLTPPDALRGEAETSTRAQTPASCPIRLRR
jgi:hypothetical protein